MAAKGSSDPSVLRVKSDEEVAALEVFGPGVDETDGVSGPGYIYVIQEGCATGYYKVGSTGDLNKRKQDLQTGNPRPLGFISYWPVKDKKIAERKAHEAAAAAGTASKLGGGTEWYTTADASKFSAAIGKAVAGL